VIPREVVRALDAADGLAYPVAAASAHRDHLDPRLLTHELREDRAG